MLVVENLVKNYGELTAVDDVSFEASAGTVFGTRGAALQVRVREDYRTTWVFLFPKVAN
jgi:ABC-type phosphonate transport system ATPase subunit